MTKATSSRNESSKLDWNSSRNARPSRKSSRTASQLASKRYKSKVKSKGSLVLHKFTNDTPLSLSRTVESYFQKRDEIFSEVKQLCSGDPSIVTEEILYDKVADATQKFNELHDEIWKSLMEDEMHLHESVNDSNSIFSNVILDMVNE